MNGIFHFYRLLMNSLTAPSPLSFCIYFILIIQLVTYCCSSELSQQSSLDSESLNDYDNAFENVIQEEENENEPEDDKVEVKRSLPVDEVSRKVQMLLVDKDKNINETYAHIKDKSTSTFKINDFIIRIQEKYEYEMCTKYLEAAKGVHDNFFTIPDDDLVNLPNDDDTQYKGDAHSRQDREDKAKDPYRMERRFRFYGEDCNAENEWYFWRDMFMTAEDDVKAIPKNTGTGGGGGIIPIVQPNTTTTTTTTQATIISGEYTYVTLEAGEMMRKFNRVWDQYKTKSICNPKYLLECDERTSRCKCQTKGIGLPTVVTQLDEDDKDEGDTVDFFTTQYYEDLRENDQGHVKIHHGKYLHKKKCVATVNLPESNLDLYITNPCDYFLPMIGLCRSDCVVNASCRSVTEQEKNAMRERSKKMDFYERIINRTLHEVYHQKCVCDTGKICRKISHENYGGATTIKSTMTSFINPFFVIFKVILAEIIIVKH